MVKALVALAQGVEEMEAVITIDVLRRAKWEVVAAALTSPTIVASRGVRLVADTAWDSVDADSFDLLVLPGGSEGTKALAADARILQTVRRFLAAGKTVAAICAAPLVLQAAGVLAGRQVTCHPAVADQLTAAPRRNDPVVEDGTLVTSQGPGTTFEFALALIRRLDGPAAARRVAEGLVLGGVA